jgi:malonyl-CoA O-methyltransferase
MIKQKISYCFSKAANTYDSNAGLQAAVGDRLIQLVFDYINSVDISSVLDLGVGTGLVTSRLLGQLNHTTQLTVCDLSYAMLTHTRARFNNLNTNHISYFQADFDKLPLSNNSGFDLIFSNMSLQWSENLFNLIDRLKSLLSDRGVLALSIPLEFTHPKIKLPYSLNYQPDFLYEFFKTNHEANYVSNVITWPFDSLYDFIQFYKKTGANLCFGENKSDINISRENILSLKTKLGAVSLEVGFLILRKL